MDSLFLNCFSCESLFNAKHLNPEDFILSCNHFRCESCSYQSKPCKLDNTRKKFEIIESDLKSFLENNPNLKDSICESHNLPEECYCETCMKLICYRCTTLHKTHEIFDENQLNELLQDCKIRFDKNFKNLLLSINQESFKVLQLRAGIKQSRKNIKRIKVQMIEDLAKCNLKFQNRKEKEFEDFKKFNKYWVDIFRRGFEDCMILREIVVKGREYLRRKREFLQAAEKDPRLLFVEGALDVEEIEFKSNSLEMKSLPYCYGLEYASVEELRYLHEYSNRSSN